MKPTVPVVVAATRKLLSPAAPRAISLIGSTQVDLGALREAIELDPVLTVKVIDYANHSFYARRVPVASLQRALVRVGWEASCDLLMRLVTEAAVTQNPALVRPMWEHSLATGVLARLLARSAGTVDPALSFTAGLVHGLGQFGLLALHQEAYAELWLEHPGGPRLAKAERARFGLDHATVGAGVLDGLAVPAALPGAVARMYRASLATRKWEGRADLALAAVLQLALTLLHDNRQRLARPDAILHHPLAERLRLSEEDAESLASRFSVAYARQLGRSVEATDDEAEDDAA